MQRTAKKGMKDTCQKAPKVSDRAIVQQQHHRLILAEVIQHRIFQLQSLNLTESPSKLGKQAVESQNILRILQCHKNVEIWDVKWCEYMWLVVWLVVWYMLSARVRLVFFVGYPSVKAGLVASAHCQPPNCGCIDQSRSMECFQSCFICKLRSFNMSYEMLWMFSLNLLVIDAVNQLGITSGQLVQASILRKSQSRRAGLTKRKRVAVKNCCPTSRLRPSFKHLHRSN